MGLQGVVIENPTEDRVVVSVTLLQRCVVVEMEVLQLRSTQMSATDGRTCGVMRYRGGRRNPGLSARVVLRDPEDLAFSNHLHRFNTLNEAACG